MEGDKKMRELDIKISKPVTKIILMVILYAIVILAFSWYIIKPDLQRLNSLNDEIWKQEERLNLLLTAQQKIKTIQNDISDFTARITQISSVLPSESDEFLFGEEILIIGKKNNVTITQLNFPKKTQGGQNENSISFNVSFESQKLDNAKSFLDSLKSFPQITELDNLNINYTKDSKTSETKYIVSIKGIIYLYQGK
jgi:Tfp pilus assembly protein PilO